MLKLFQKDKFLTLKPMTLDFVYFHLWYYGLDFIYLQHNK